MTHSYLISWLIATFAVIISVVGSSSSVELKIPIVNSPSISTNSSNTVSTSIADDDNSTNIPSRRNISIGILSWNLAEKSPSAEDCSFLSELKDCDLVALGIQECEDLRPRRHEGRRSKKWQNIHRKIFGKRYECLAAHKFGGLQLVLYANKHAAKLVSGVQTIEVACGIGNVLNNKGAISVLLRMQGGKTLTFVNAHMAAHQHMVSF
jgi:hypothetical protein